ncbi:UPF0481 protein At3g47200-like [Curcuma longa]|uniref:UPF0481 protein At3g47200-like n=1 Tax=Curcuma longa TaxID=136217 RepID=UPI003D9E6D86
MESEVAQATESVPTASVNLDIDGLSRSFMETLSSASGKPKKDIQATIFRVPENIRRANIDSFEPKMVSLGPYHRENQRFLATDERIKLPCANNFFRRQPGLVMNFIRKIKDKESDLRCAYSENIKMNSDDFVKMMMLDFAFMFEFLWEQAGGHRTQMEEYYSCKWAAPSIINDMLVVENQFPFPTLLFLLYAYTAELYRHDTSLTKLAEFLCYDLMNKIHQNLSPTSTSSLSLTLNKIHQYLSPTSTLILNNILQNHSPTSSLTLDLTLNLSTRSFEKSGHLLHLFHSSLVSVLWAKEISEPVEKKIIDLKDVDLSSFPSAERLRAMRMRFVNKTNGSSFLDITFDKGKRSMEIPQLVINDDNIALIRNLIAFEQQCHGIYNCVSTYIWFMDCLINTGKDVAVLRQQKIIVSRLNSDEEVAHIFNELRRTNALVAEFNHLYLAKVMKDVQSYRRNKCNRLCALWNLSWLRQNYFKNRWVTIGVTAAIFFILLTLVQTAFAILSYLKQ